MIPNRNGWAPNQEPPDQTPAEGFPANIDPADPENQTPVRKFRLCSCGCGAVMVGP